MRIRKLRDSEWDAASRVLWKSFLHSSEGVSPEGFAFFGDVTAPLSLAMNAVDGTILFFGAFEKDELCGVGALKEKKKILLLYILPAWQGRGVGTRLLARLEKMASGSVVLDSSDAALSFYCARGYVPCGERRTENGLSVTPMKKKLQSNQKE